MANRSDSTMQFFKKATPEQWSYMLTCYKDAAHAKAQLRTKKGGPEQYIKLDNWFQETLPKLIRSRKDPHLEYTELVDLMKWKLLRTKYKPASLDLVKTNTERNVKSTTTRAFKRMPNIASALQALTAGLKGIGTATASAILASAYPEYAPYMAEECMVSTPEVEAEDYTQAEYFKYADHYQRFAAKLAEKDPSLGWNPHKVELAIWSHYILRLYRPELIDAMPCQAENGSGSQQGGGQDGEGTEEDSNQEAIEMADGNRRTSNGGVASSCDEDSQQSNGTLAEDSNSLPANGSGSNGSIGSPQKQNGNHHHHHHHIHHHVTNTTDCTTDNDTRSSLVEESSQASADCEASSDNSRSHQDGSQHHHHHIAPVQHALQPELYDLPAPTATAVPVAADQICGGGGNLLIDTTTTLAATGGVKRKSSEDSDDGVPSEQRPQQKQSEEMGLKKIKLDEAAVASASSTTSTKDSEAVLPAEETEAPPPSATPTPISVDSQ